MKKLYFVIALIFISGFAFSQSWQEDFNSTVSIDKKTGANFYEIQKSFNNYWSNYNVKGGYYYKDGKKYKAAGWKQFRRWEWYWESRINKQTGEFPNINTFKEQQTIKKGGNSKADESNWSTMGPSNTSGGYYGIGRINCITFHPTDKNTFWIGTPSGGIWKTTTGGASWTILNEDLAILGVSEIVLANDYLTSKTIYIATGDRDAGNSYSIGVLKSTDDGETWNQTGLTFNVTNRYRITRMLMHPQNSNIIHVATNGGLFFTDDGGVTWDSQFAGKIFFDMEFKPNCEDTVLYAAMYSWDGSPELYKTTDGGTTWNSEFSFPVNATRVELDVTKSDSTIVYAIASTKAGGLEGVYKSANSGLDFTKVYDGTALNANLLNWTTVDTVNDQSGQGGYDLTLSVSPTNKDILYLGGVNTWKSINGGVNWEINNVWTSYDVYNPEGKPTVHADKHYMEYQDENTFFEANDGGIYKTTNGGASWADLSGNLVISQMYKLSASATVKDEVIAGLQDNGSKLRYTENWYDVKGGDGMECLIDYADDKVQYATYVYGQIDLTTDRWVNFVQDITDERKIPGGPNGAWVTPYIIDPINSKTLYLGYEDVWKTTNRGGSWTKISNLSLSNKIRSIAICPNDNNTLYITDYDNFYRTTNGGSTWSNLTAYLPIVSADASLTSITVDVYNPQKLWISFGGFYSDRVFESTNGGNTWTNISTGLPSIPVNYIIQNKYSQATQLYAATDFGVYFKNGSSSWELFSNNLPSVEVTELDIYYDKTTPANSVLYASTFGRGLWKSTVATFNDISGVNTDIESLGIKIYPNPTEGKFSIESSRTKISEISVVDLSGREVYHKEVGNNDVNTIDLSSQPKGLYLIQFNIDGNYVSSKILVK